MIEAPDVVCEMSKVPPVDSATPLDVAMLPVPDSASVAPALILVAFV